MHSTEFSDTSEPGFFYSPTSRKSRMAAFLLAFFLGMFGAHRFYVGKIPTAIAQLILTLTVFGMLISGPWVLVDWIVILCGSFKDDMGRRITRWDN